MVNSSILLTLTVPSLLSLLVATADEDVQSTSTSIPTFFSTYVQTWEAVANDGDDDHTPSPTPFVTSVSTSFHTLLQEEDDDDDEGIVNLGTLEVLGTWLGAVERLGSELLLGAADLEGVKLGTRLGAVVMLGCELLLGAEDSEGVDEGAEDLDGAEDSRCAWWYWWSRWIRRSRCLGRFACLCSSRIISMLVLSLPVGVLHQLRKEFNDDM